MERGWNGKKQVPEGDASNRLLRKRRWKDRRKKPWRKGNRLRLAYGSQDRAAAGRGRFTNRAVRRVCLLLLAAELAWGAWQQGIPLIWKREVSWVREVPGDAGEGAAGRRWFGFGADWKDGSLYFFHGEEEVVK